MRLLVLLLCAAALAAAVAPAGAIVPPRDCGMTTVKGKRFNVRADQISCKTAKPHARRYLSTGRRPSGYRCRNYSSRTTKLKFKCDRGVRSFFAIRR